MDFRLLENEGIRSAHYHAGMTPKNRMDIQNKWRSGEFQVVVATIAFGKSLLSLPSFIFTLHPSHAHLHVCCSSSWLQAWALTNPMFAMW